jgi:hypothetical protein
MGCSASNTLKDSIIQNEQAKKNNLRKKKSLKKRTDEEENLNHSNGKRKKKKEEIKEIEDKKVKEKEDEKKIFLKVHILMKNLEVKITDSKNVKKKLKNIFDILLENDEEFKVEVMIEKISNFFIDYLKPINKKNYESVKNILNSLYEKDKNPNFFSEYLYEAFDNLSDFGKLGEVEETKIDDYIIKNLYKNEEIQKRKNELKQNRKKNYIIKYNDFIQIVKDYKINMDNLVFEYLLYKMKCGLPLNVEYSLDDLNFKIFLDYLDRSNELDIKEEYSLKESVLDNKIENIGIEFKNNNS